MRPTLVRILVFLAVTAVLLAALSLYGARFDAPPETLTFLDRNGTVIGTLNSAYRGFQIWTPLAGIPESVIASTLKREDRFFFRHPGVNPWAMVKAAASNLAAGRVIRGGSTITQQLAKNMMLEREGGVLTRSFASKLRATLLALALELRHPKAWILERYLNSVYYGHRCYGIAAAARYYYDGDLHALTAEQIEKLTALPRSPGRTTGIIPRPKSRVPKIYGRHFLEMAARRSDGSANIIRTTLDLELQKRVEDGLVNVLKERQDLDPFVTGAAVVIDPTSGDVLALAGSRDYFDESVSGAVNAALSPRQPGSTLKPFTYFAAFAKGMTPDTVVNDAPTNFSTADSDTAYMPQNFDRLFRGTVTIREALANSYNVPAVKVLNGIGLSYYHNVLKGFGFTTFPKPPQHYGLAVTLGSGEVTLIELTNAYAALARGGSYKPFRILETDPDLAARQILPDAKLHAARITDILMDEGARLKTFGHNAALSVDGFPVAVKTGTSHGLRDNWTAGYAPQAAVGVWVGHADGTPLKDTTGATGAAPAWHAVMEASLRGQTPLPFPFPADARRPNFERRDGVLRPRPAEPSWGVTQPLERSRYRLHPYVPAKHQKIPAEVKFSGSRPARLDWFLDDAWIASSAIGTNDGAARAWIEPEPGKHVLTVLADDGTRREVTFAVAGVAD